jgi:hypothetical protein
MSMSITRKSPLTGRTITRSINITPQQYHAWQNGTLIQDAMPNITADEREFIKTGLTAHDWSRINVDPLFGPE